MARGRDQTIGYDIRSHWRRDNSLLVRDATPADTAGLAEIIRRGDVRALTDRSPAANSNESRQVIESSYRLIGAFDVHISEKVCPDTPLPWSRTSDEALVQQPDWPCLVVDGLFVHRIARVSPATLIRDTVLRVVQSEGFAQARVDIPFQAGRLSAEERLMTIYAAFEQRELDDELVALWLRAGFYLQGYYEGPERRWIARLNWSNTPR